MSSSSQKKVITVFGATGASGGSVARYLLEDGTFAVRAITRNASSPAAQALKAKGAQVVEADLDHPETLTTALAGTYGVSALTDFWGLFPKIGDMHKTQAAEYAQGIALVDAARAAGVQHFVWFTLPHAPTVPHFEGKYQVSQYVEKSGLPYTIFENVFYYENIANPIFGFSKRLADGTLSIEFPIPAHYAIPFYSVAQTGAWILQVFKNREAWLGKKMFAMGEHLTPLRIAEILNANGIKASALNISPEDFRALEHSENPVLVEMYWNMKFFIDYTQPPNSAIPEAALRELFPFAHTLEEAIKSDAEFKKALVSI
ncbi:NAD(P)-binding protein [Exidia glandulosa HHB12029]|uniref:NAD(P)-binding protein n=1 Tax=Exidia glandulosa HHB12029 TaxID=1314781 RepID=A0A165QCD8_EXIGL|nr:NAD(P)-binding protein [Exidia glandulosa HHB12029]